MDIYRALHIIFVITWFAGLFYIVRLMIYHVEADKENKQSYEVLNPQFTIMEKRLWYGITWPSAIITLIFGLIQLWDFLPIWDSPWLVLKVILVFFLYLYHFICGSYLKKIWNGNFEKSSTYLRYWNEVATLFLVSIVFLVVMKDSMDMLKALLGFILFSLLLVLGIRVYKRLRKG